MPPELIDRAAERELQLRDDALRDQQRRSGLGDASQWDRLSASRCECGEPIPEPRRQALPGVQNCVDCQRVLELKGRR